ncbi:MAG: hypothetical protein LLF94_04860 [Chlamydiales bacterium]|nr:hypothetical protein [Chlamydiales bacterium]
MIITPYIGYKEIAQAFVHEASTQVKKAFFWAGHKVEVLSKDLPEPVKKIATSVYWALPYTAALLIIPPFYRSITVSLIIGLWTATGREIDETIGIENRRSLYTGIQNASLISIAIDVVRLIATKDVFLLGNIVAEAAFAITCWWQIIPAQTPEPKPEAV